MTRQQHSNYGSALEAAVASLITFANGQRAKAPSYLGCPVH
jgi:hypothetical protein